MTSWLFLFIAIVYLCVIVALFAYGVNFFYLTFRTWRDRQGNQTIPPLVDLPRV